MSDNDIPSYTLELARSTSADVVTPVQPEVVYTQPPDGGISNQMLIVVLAVLVAVIAIVYSRKCDCGK